MRVVAFVNGGLGLEAIRVVRDAGDEIVSLVVHPADRAREREAIVQAAGVDAEGIFPGDRLDEPAVLEAIAARAPDIGISAGFGFVLRRAVLDLPAGGCVNLHTSYLPYNRGAHPNVWAIIDGTPAGATLHLMDEQVDAGPILAQVRVSTRPTDTGKTLYTRQQRAAVSLLRRAWPELRAGRLEPRPQPHGGSSHRVADLASTDRLDWNGSYVLREVVNRIRARRFPPYQGCYTEIDGRRFFLDVRLRPERKPAPR